ncbi:MAG: protein kinase [Candidatus Obscuribacterales bacterium]|nr:protein kinase [Candidatus Obscuribacterales bacterium]
MSQDFGHYEVLAEIGRGGMGIIYKAMDPRLNRFVAIKQLVLDHVDADKKEEFRERFRREAILAAGMNHANLVSIYDVSIAEDNSYYVMELLEGRSLRQELEERAERKFTTEEFFPLFKQICSGLSHAHDMGLVHRDIKPDNIFVLHNNKAKITDFGIARSADGADQSKLTKPGVMLGTLSYVSPEQLQDASNVDHRADIFSLSVVAYEVLSGQVPFAGDGLTSTMMAIMSKEPKPANETNPDVSSDVAAVIAKAMRKRAEDRYPSVFEFEKEMEKAITLGRPSGRESMLRSGITGTASNTAYAPGVPMSTPRPSAGSEGGLRPLGNKDGAAKTPVKPWLAGRNTEPKQPVSKITPVTTQSMVLAKPLGQIGKSGEDKDCFMEPVAICASAGKIVVADSVLRRLTIFSREGVYQANSKTASNAVGSKTMGGVFSKPSALAIDPRGRIYAADASDQFIRIFDVGGLYVKEIQNRFGKDGGILGLCIDQSNNLYVSDPDNGCVHVLHADTGMWNRKLGSKGSGEGQLQLPQGVAVDSLGQVFVVDYGTSKINIFSKAGIFVRSFGEKGSGNGQFNVPRGIAIDKNDRVYVADSLNHRVQVFSTTGYFLYSFGGRGSELGRFMGPADLSVDPVNNCLYVADRGNSRVQSFELLAN